MAPEEPHATRVPATRLSLARLAAYGLPALPLAVLTLPVYIYVPSFYADELGLPLALVGQVLLLIRLFDGITDPVVGVLSDRIAWRGTRRKLWFGAAIPVTVLSAWMLLVPPEGAGVGHLALWGLALSLGWTLAILPYSAWGAELTGDYLERNRVSAARETLVVAGTVLATATPVALAVAGIDGRGAVLETLALFVALGLPPLALVTLVAIPEPRDYSRRRLHFAEGLRHMRTNRPFLRLLTAFLVNGLANALPATLFLFFVEYRLALPGREGLFLLVYFLCGVLAVPLWLCLARRSSKHRAWCVAMIMGCAAFITVPLIPPGTVLPFLIVCIVTGLALGADLVLPPSIQADVIDTDTAASGEQRSGTYFAIWGMATKLALALAAGIGFPLLAATGFDPAADRFAAAGLLTLALLYAFVPTLLKIAAIALMWRFPLDAAEQGRLRARIEARA